MNEHKQDPVSFQDVKDEIFDMTKPADPTKITLQDLLNRFVIFCLFLYISSAKLPFTVCFKRQNLLLFKVIKKGTLIFHHNIERYFNVFWYIRDDFFLMKMFLSNGKGIFSTQAIFSIEQLISRWVKKSDFEIAMGNFFKWPEETVMSSLDHFCIEILFTIGM